MNADQSRMVLPERRVVHLSYENYIKALSASVVSDKAMFNFDGEKLFETRKAVTVDGMLILVDGIMHSSLDHSYCQAYKLMPADLYFGPTYKIPAHQAIGYTGDSITTPEGHIRRRSIDTGLLCIVNGQLMVFAEALKLTSRLPRSVLDLKRQDVENSTSTQLISQSPCWLERGEWIDYKGVPVLVKTSHIEQKHFFVHGRNRKGIFDIHLRTFDLLDELLADRPSKPEVNFEAIEQLSFF